MHLLVNNMADPDMSNYELRNNSTVFEELEVSIVDWLLNGHDEHCTKENEAICS
jgi:hypothetical protein